MKSSACTSTWKTVLLKVSKPINKEGFAVNAFNAFSKLFFWPGQTTDCGCKTPKLNEWIELIYQINNILRHKKTGKIASYCIFPV